MRFFGYEFFKARPTQFLGDLTKITIADGDVCVLMSPRQLSLEESSSVRTQWQAVFGDSVTLLVLDSGMRLGVLSPAQAASVHQTAEDAKKVQAALEAKA